MERMKPDSLSGVQEFFLTELKAVLSKHKLEATPYSVNYLADLMVRFIDTRNFFVQGADGKLQDNLLTDLYAESMQADLEARKAALRRMGDIALMVSGYFSESLNRKIVDVDYYFGMGGSAYHNLAQMQITSAMRQVFSELSVKFRPFSDVLGEMSERSGLQSNKDVLRLYERWVQTGNDRLKTILTDQGISIPIKVDTKTRH